MADTKDKKSQTKFVGRRLDVSREGFRFGVYRVQPGKPEKLVALVDTARRVDKIVDALNSK